jgi:molybdate transport system substrate-binding protein
MALEIYEEVRRSLVESAAGALVRSVQPKGDAVGTIHLSAAISLQEAIGQILAEFALVEPNVRVRAIFGASNELADQLLAGAPGDVFISAEAAEVDRLAAAKLVAKDARVTVARNGLAIVGGTKVAPIKKPADILDARFKRVAVAEPACPLGGYSKAYLEKSKLYEKLLLKILHVDNSRAVLAAVASGAAQAGVAFSSDASGRGAWQQLYPVPTKEAATTYTAAAIGRAAARADVKSLCDFLTSPAAERCYRRCGLRPA